MPFYAEEQLHSAYGAFSTLPLPAAAVVIDVRHNEHHDLSLLDNLATNAEDLAMTMRLKQIPRWRHLSDSFDFLLLNTLQPYAEPHEETDFILTTRAGQQVPLQGLENLASFIGRNYLDAVRNARISATRDGSTQIAMPATEVIDTEQPTVRVFFLVDMEQQASLHTAACCAQRLKMWTEEAHGPRRLSRAAYIQTVAFCLNAHPSLYHDALIHMPGQLPNSAIDMVILQQSYSDDEAYVGGNAQIYQAELILYTLLLHWPDTLEKTIEDSPVLSIHANSGVIIPSWPVYIVGISALEYSAHWAARWLNYGVACKMLDIIADVELAEQDRPLSQIKIQKWLKLWWQEVQTVVPFTLIRTIDDMQAFDRLQRVLSESALQKVSPSHALQKLTMFRNQVSELYTGSGNTLQYALESKWSILEQVKQVYISGPSEAESFPQYVDKPYQQLVHLYTVARQILSQHFQAAGGALPRAMYQLSALTASIDEIRRVASYPPDLADRRAQFERQAEMAYKRLLDRLKIWPVPLLGNLPRSTVLSLCLVILMGTFVVSGIGWQPFLEHGYAFSSLFRLPGDFITSIKILLVCLLVSCEVFYLVMRNRSIQREYRSIHSELCATAQSHLSEAGAVIASYVALDILQRSDLYAPGADISPYELRLRELTTILKGVREHAARQHMLANARLRFVLEPQQSRHLDEYRWSRLSNRKDIFPWDRVEEAFLQSYNELNANIAPVNLFSEMLLRLLGTESMTELLEHVLHKQQKDEEARFQAISTLLVIMTFLPDVALPKISATLPLLKQFAILKDRSIQEPSILTANVPDMQNILRGALLERAREESIMSHASHSHALATSSPAFILAGWVGSQLYNHPHLLSIFASDNVLAHLAQREAISPAQALETLRSLCTLPGRPDEIAGNDHYYLFIAPDDTGEAFIKTCHQLRESHIQLAPFPDQEKLVYFHIHRVRQILPPALH